MQRGKGREEENAVRRAEGEAALGREAGKEAGISVSSSVPISGPKHIPIQVQVPGAASSTSSTSPSSADEDFHPQPSLRSKVTTLGQPKRALLAGAIYHPGFRPNVDSSGSGFSLGGACFIASDSNCFFYLEYPKNDLFFSNF